MATGKIEIHNFDSVSPEQITNEEYSDVGGSAFQLGTAARGFKGSTDVVITNSGYQEIENTGSLGAFVGATVPAIATQSDYELDVTVDTTLYQLDDISINVADDWDDVCLAIQTSLQTATSSTEECEIVGDNIRVTSKTYGSGSSIVIAAGTAGTGSGDLLAVIDALGATYTTNVLTAVDGATITEDVDYEIGGLDRVATLQAGYDVFTRVTMLDSDYQTGYVYITYKTVVSMPDAEYFNNHEDRITTNAVDITTNSAAIAAIGGQVIGIKGLEISNAADADHDITIQPGLCANDDNDEYITLSSAITKQIDATWAEGTNSGGLFSGASLTTGTLYYLYIIKKDSDGTVDAGFDDNQDGTNVPAGWSSYRRIRGAVLTDGSSNILGFYQKDDYFWYDDYIVDHNTIPSVTTRFAVALSVPPNFQAIFTVKGADSSDCYIKIFGGYENDSVPSTTNCDLRVSSGCTQAQSELIKPTNSNSQIYARCNLTTMIDFTIMTKCFIDTAT